MYGLLMHVACTMAYIGSSDARVKADFHSVPENVARSIFSKRFLLKRVKSTTANEISYFLG